MAAADDGEHAEIAVIHIKRVCGISLCRIDETKLHSPFRGFKAAFHPFMSARRR
jgi:hypothetical protein